MILSFGLFVSSIFAASGGQGWGDSCQCTYSKPDATMLGCRYFAPFCSIMTNNGGNTINAYVVTSCTNGIIGPDCISCPTTTPSQLQFTPCPYVFVQKKYENEEKSLLEQLGDHKNITMNCCPTASHSSPDSCWKLCVGECDLCTTVCAGSTSEPAANRETSSTRTNPQGLTGNETKTIIGAVVGSVLGAIVILLLIQLICCLLKRRSTQKETDEYQGCTVDQGGALPPAFSFDNPEYSQPSSGDSKKYEQLNPTNEIKKDKNSYETLTHGDEYDNDIPSIVKSVGDAKSYDNIIIKKDDMDEPKNNVSSPGNVHTDFMGNNSMIGEAGNKSDPPAGGNDDTTLIDNSLYGSDKPAAVKIQGNDDTILVDNSLYGSGRD